MSPAAVHTEEQKAQRRRDQNAKRLARRRAKVRIEAAANQGRAPVTANTEPGPSNVVIPDVAAEPTTPAPPSPEQTGTASARTTRRTRSRKRREERERKALERAKAQNREPLSRREREQARRGAPSRSNRRTQNSNSRDGDGVVVPDDAASAGASDEEDATTADASAPHSEDATTADASAPHLENESSATDANEDQPSRKRRRDSVSSSHEELDVVSAEESTKKGSGKRLRKIRKKERERQLKREHALQEDIGAAPEEIENSNEPPVAPEDSADDEPQETEKQRKKREKREKRERKEQRKLQKSMESAAAEQTREAEDEAMLTDNADAEDKEVDVFVMAPSEPEGEPSADEHDSEPAVSVSERSHEDEGEDRAHSLSPEPQQSSTEAVDGEVENDSSSEQYGTAAEEPAGEQIEEHEFETAEPDIKVEESDAETEEPDVETEEPGVETEEPGVETEEPDAKSEDLDVEFEEREVDAENHYTKSQESPTTLPEEPEEAEDLPAVHEDSSAEDQQVETDKQRRRREKRERREERRKAKEQRKAIRRAERLAAEIAQVDGIQSELLSKPEATTSDHDAVVSEAEVEEAAPEDPLTEQHAASDNEEAEQDKVSEDPLTEQHAASDIEEAEQDKVSDSLSQGPPYATHDDAHPEVESGEQVAEDATSGLEEHGGPPSEAGCRETASPPPADRAPIAQEAAYDDDDMSVDYEPAPQRSAMDIYDVPVSSDEDEDEEGESRRMAVMEARRKRKEEKAVRKAARKAKREEKARKRQQRELERAEAEMMEEGDGATLADREEGGSQEDGDGGGDGDGEGVDEDVRPKEPIEASNIGDELEAIVKPAEAATSTQDTIAKAICRGSYHNRLQTPPPRFRTEFPRDYEVPETPQVFSTPPNARDFTPVGSPSPLNLYKAYRPPIEKDTGSSSTRKGTSRADNKEPRPCLRPTSPPKTPGQSEEEEQGDMEMEMDTTFTPPPSSPEIEDEEDVEEDHEKDSQEVAEEQEEEEVVEIWGTAPPTSSVVVIDDDESGPSNPPPTTPKSKRKRVKTQTGEVSPFFSAPNEETQEIPPKKRAKRGPSKSPHFPKPKKGKDPKKPRIPAGVSTIRWPTSPDADFGLVQEKLRDNPLHVLIATVFLNRTNGKVALPKLNTFLEDYPTAEALANADFQTVKDFLQPLGLNSTRAKRLIAMGETWLKSPPAVGVAHKQRDYPLVMNRPFPDGVLATPMSEQRETSWEISHIPGVGPYALDSWRIFCRDAFLGVEDTEWRSVNPNDKELRSYVRWKWSLEGRVWKEDGDEFRENEDGKSIVISGTPREVKSGYDDCDEEDSAFEVHRKISAGLRVAMDKEGAYSEDDEDPEVEADLESRLVPSLKECADVSTDAAKEKGKAVLAPQVNEPANDPDPTLTSKENEAANAENPTSKCNEGAEKLAKATKVKKAPRGKRPGAKVPPMIPDLVEDTAHDSEVEKATKARRPGVRFGKRIATAPRPKKPAVPKNPHLPEGVIASNCSPFLPAYLLADQPPRKPPGPGDVNISPQVFAAAADWVPPEDRVLAAANQLQHSADAFANITGPLPTALKDPIRIVGPVRYVPRSRVFAT